jgi:hypothetical protein
MRLGLVLWDSEKNITDAIGETLTTLGVTVIPFQHTLPLPPGLDAVLARGPLGTMAPIGRQLIALPASRRPKLIYWITSPLPNPTLPVPLVTALGTMRSQLDLLAVHPSENGHWRSEPLWSGLVDLGWRYRNWGDLYWLARNNVLSVLVISSVYLARKLRELGFEPHVELIGVHASWHDDLQLERDIPVLWLGSQATARRVNLLGHIRKELSRRGVELKVIDGVEHPPVFGPARVKLLNRAKIVLNLVRKPWDNNGFRMYLASANGALCVSELILPHSPMVAGEHFVQVPTDKLAETICYYLERDAERERIAARGRAFVLENLMMRDGLERIIELAS